MAKFERKFVAKIATDYANSDLQFSYRHFCDKYGVSKSQFYSILDSAVVEGVVSNFIAHKMSLKAMYNSKEKAGEAAKERSRRHYASLDLKRRTFLLNKKSTIEMADMYAGSPLNKKTFCLEYCYTVDLFDRSLINGIKKGWVSKKLMDLIKEKSLQLNPGAKTSEFWEQLEALRNRQKNS